MLLNNEVISHPNSICTELANHFEIVYSSPITFDPNNFTHITQSELTLSSLSLSHYEVINALNTIDTNKGAGPDKIAALFLKNTAIALADPGLLIFNKSLATGVFPHAWKLSYLLLIFKSGDRCKIENYRCIAILSLLPKIFEKLVTPKLFTFCARFINVKQHGFFKGRSTVSNLVDYSNFILGTMDLGHQVDLLIFKLGRYGISGPLLQWIHSYLSNRSQIVKFGNVCSPRILVSSGVPQGSHLGPLLLILFINDVLSLFSGINYLLYADDLKLFKSISSLSDAACLQRNCIILSNWCCSNGMILHTDKCVSISFSRKRCTMPFEYTLNSCALLKKEVVKDLGVWFYTKMSFKYHIDYVVSKGRRMLGFIKRRASEFDDPYVTKTIFCSLVRSTLEYCHIV